MTVYSAAIARDIGGEIKNSIPRWAWQNDEIMRGYLSGVFDGDGGVSGGDERGSVVLTFGGGHRREGLAREIQWALLLFGIRTRLHKYPGYQPNDKGRVMVRVMRPDVQMFCAVCNFLGDTKREAVKAIIGLRSRGGEGYGFAFPIKSVVPLGVQPVYDIVDSSTGRFCANGIVVHNSGAQGVIKLVMAETMDLITDLGLEEVVKPLLQIHDELLFECHESIADDWIAMVGKVIEGACELRVPIGWGGGHAGNWGDLKH